MLACFTSFIWTVLPTFRSGPNTGLLHNLYMNCPSYLQEWHQWWPTSQPLYELSFLPSGVAPMMAYFTTFIWTVRPTFRSGTNDGLLHNLNLNCPSYLQEWHQCWSASQTLSELSFLPSGVAPCWPASQPLSELSFLPSGVTPKLACFTSFIWTVLPTSMSGTNAGLLHILYLNCSSYLQEWQQCWPASHPLSELSFLHSAVAPVLACFTTFIWTVLSTFRSGTDAGLLHILYLLLQSVHPLFKLYDLSEETLVQLLCHTWLTTSCV